VELSAARPGRDDAQAECEFRSEVTANGQRLRIPFLAAATKNAMVPLRSQDEPLLRVTPTWLFPLRGA